ALRPEPPVHTVTSPGRPRGRPGTLPSSSGAVGPPSGAVARRRYPGPHRPCTGLVPALRRVCTGLAPPPAGLRRFGRAAQPGPAALDDRPEQRDQTEHHDGADQRILEEHPEAALRGEQRLSERLLGLIAEH